MLYVTDLCGSYGMVVHLTSSSAVQCVIRYDFSAWRRLESRFRCPDEGARPGAGAGPALVRHAKDLFRTDQTVDTEVAAAAAAAAAVAPDKTV